ncbi:MAG: UDP-N-acetylglucosamine 2-epimerase, partial [bacterium]
MLDRYGNTYIELEKSGFKNVFQYINQMAHTSRDMDIVLASTIQGLSHYVKERRPDLLVVHGDRVEALAGAIVGGERSGTVDELIRHAVTKMAHLHFVSNKEAADRLIQMGEDANCVFAIGSPDIDVMFSETLPTLQEAKTY